MKPAGIRKEAGRQDTGARAQLQHTAGGEALCVKQRGSGPCTPELLKHMLGKERTAAPCYAAGITRARSQGRAVLVQHDLNVLGTWALCLARYTKRQAQRIVFAIDHAQSLGIFPAAYLKQVHFFVGIFDTVRIGARQLKEPLR